MNTEEGFKKLALELKGRVPRFEHEPHMPLGQMWWFDLSLPKVFVSTDVWHQLERLKEKP